LLKELNSKCRPGSGRHFYLLKEQAVPFDLELTKFRNIPPIRWFNRRRFLKRRSPMKKHIAVSLLGVALLVPGAAFAQSTTARGAANGAAAGGNAAGPVGEIVGGTVGAAVGAAVEIPNAVITSIQGERAPSVRVQERIVVGEPLPPTVKLRTVPRYSEYRYAVVNDQRVIVDPRTRRVVRIID
jgi:hypothetical protein